MMIRRKVLALAFSTVSTAALAVDLPIEINAAQMAARRAGRGTAMTLEEIHQRMQSSINCLVGPKGEGFDSKVPNPCETTGNGVIPDTTDPGKKAKYLEAVHKLKSGIGNSDRTVTQQIALEAADMIDAVASN